MQTMWFCWPPSGSGASASEPVQSPSMSGWCWAVKTVTSVWCIYVPSLTGATGFCVRDPARTSDMDGSSEKSKGRSWVRTLQRLIMWCGSGTSPYIKHIAFSSAVFELPLAAACETKHWIWKHAEEHRVLLLQSFSVGLFKHTIQTH